MSYAAVFGVGFYISLVLNPVHCLTAYFIAIMVAQRDVLAMPNVTLLKIMGPPVFVRGVFVFSSIIIPACIEDDATVYAVWGSVIAVVFALCVSGIKWAQSRMPAEHVRQAGYFRVFGEGHQPLNDISDGEEELSLERAGAPVGSEKEVEMSSVVPAERAEHGGRNGSEPRPPQSRV